MSTFLHHCYNAGLVTEKTAISGFEGYRVYKPDAPCTLLVWNPGEWRSWPRWFYSLIDPHDPRSPRYTEVTPRALQVARDRLVAQPIQTVPVSRPLSTVNRQLYQRR